MKDTKLNTQVDKLGVCKIPSPMKGMPFINDDERVLYHSSAKEIENCIKAGKTPLSFEMAGPREKIYFDPSKLKCGIVTCGGLCPGLNDVIRSIVLSLFYHYGVRTVFGFRYGFEGLSYRYGHTPFELTPSNVEDIHEKGGTILGSSRGPQDVGEMVDTLEQMNVGILFTIGGDGTMHGAQAIAEEVKKRRLKISIIGIPKTIDNDIGFVDQSFGFETAVYETRHAIYSAHMESLGARNGVGLVKLMGRHSGFIAAFATLANSDVNFCLIPESNFTLEGFLKELKERLENRGHAVVVVGEGAGQNLMKKTNARDSSGNIRLGDIGAFLKDQIKIYSDKHGMNVTLKYIDPSYMIRSVPASPHDSALCLLMAHNAVHAGMSGRTNIVIGYWKREFTHLPISLSISRRKTIDPNGRLWSSVVACTGQKREIL